MISLSCKEFMNSALYCSYFSAGTNAIKFSALNPYLFSIESMGVPCSLDDESVPKSAQTNLFKRDLVSSSKDFPPRLKSTKPPFSFAKYLTKTLYSPPPASEGEIGIVSLELLPEVKTRFFP